jgi:hypothetical protein
LRRMREMSVHHQFTTRGIKHEFLKRPTLTINVHGSIELCPLTRRH